MSLENHSFKPSIFTQNDAIKHHLNRARLQINSLEAEVLLASALKVNRSFLYSHPEYILSPMESQVFQKLLDRRLLGEPVAYILGEKEFWSLPFLVNSATLIPRPETELLVTAVLEKLPATMSCVIADLGTGCGAIAVALASMRPAWKVMATDHSKEALMVATKNAQNQGLSQVTFLHGDWYDALLQKNLTAIVSNPPYLSLDDPHLLQGDLRFEPHSALVSGKSGLEALNTIIEGALDYLIPGGWLFLEHGYHQAFRVREQFNKIGYVAVKTWHDLSGIERITMAQRPH